MNSFYQLHSPYGMSGGFDPETGPEQPFSVATGTFGPAAPTASQSLLQTIKNVGSQLAQAGVVAAPALIAKITQKKTAEKRAKAPAAPAPGFAPPPASGGFPQWVIPVAVGGVALVAVMFFTTRKRS